MAFAINTWFFGTKSLTESSVAVSTSYPLHNTKLIFTCQPILIMSLHIGASLDQGQYCIRTARTSRPQYRLPTIFVDHVDVHDMTKKNLEDGQAWGLKGNKGKNILNIFSSHLLTKFKVRGLQSKLSEIVLFSLRNLSLLSWIYKFNDSLKKHHCANPVWVEKIPSFIRISGLTQDSSGRFWVIALMWAMWSGVEWASNMSHDILPDRYIIKVS